MALKTSLKMDQRWTFLKIDQFIEKFNKNIRMINKSNNIGSNSTEDINDYLYALAKTNIKLINKIDD